MLTSDMPSKTRNTNHIVMDRSGQQDEGSGECVGTSHCQLDYNIVKLPALQMKKIVEKGSAATMADIYETISNASSWVHEQKARMKDLIKEASGRKAVPKTPRRGKTFANLRETALLYRASIHSLEFHDDSAAVLKKEVEEVTGTCEVALRESVQILEQKQMEHSRRTSDGYISASENSGRHFPVSVKVECDSPFTVDNPEDVVVLSANSKAPIKEIHVKEEACSSNEPAATSNVFNAGFNECGKMVTRSASRKNASEVELSNTKHSNVKWAKPGQEKMVYAAAQAREQLDGRVAAGASHTRLQRTGHQHIVTTPCKVEYKTAVQRVMDEQDMARNSGSRVVVATASRVNTAISINAVAAMANSRSVSKEKLKALRREKEDLAAQLREEQCKERAERIRKEREEKAFRAQRRREQKEIEERLKVEARKQKEIRDERRREELRLQKSPARSKVGSRVVSPARAPKVATNTVGSKVLFPCTPGRVPSKAAKVLLSPGGETSKEPTMNTPSREAKRKHCIGKKIHVSSEDSMESDSVSPLRVVTNRQEFLREERQRIMREQQERQERLREEERRRLKAYEGQPSVKHELHNVKMGISDTNCVFLKEENRLIREEKKECLFEEDKEQRILNPEEIQNREKGDVLLGKKDDRIEALVEGGDKHEDELKEIEEQQQGVLDENKKDVVAVENKEEAQNIEEQENLLNISSSVELHNRHFDNVGLNNSTAKHKLKSLHSSYEITPDKVLKPSSENNYDIEDLSSGDETDQEDAPRKKVPSWAEGNELRCALEKQSAILKSGKFDPNEYFKEITAPDLALIFGTSKRYPRRGSSGLWESPIGQPRQGIGAFQRSFIKK